MKIKTIILALVMGTAHAQTETTALTNLKRTGVDLAWSRNITGQGIVIGIIDQGFDLSHRDFQNKILANKNFYDAGTVTWGSHGTAMASIAAGARNGSGTVGVAPNANLILAQAGPGGLQNVLTDRAVGNALSWMSTMRPAVINMSFGAEYSTTFQRSVTMSNRNGVYIANSKFGTNYGASDLILRNYVTAANVGSILVVSAGNQALPYASFPAMYASRTDVNGRLELGGRMIVVGAVDNSNRITDFSNRAGHLCQNYSGLRCRDQYLTRDFFVVAPGTNLVSAVPNQLGRGRDSAVLTSGTSQAAAYVTGGIALIKQAWPQLRSEQIVNLILTTAHDLGVRGTDDIYGRGLIDLNKAVQPQGQLVIAAKDLKLSTTSVYTTKGSMNSNLVNILRSSSILTNAQVFDSYGRNYIANLAQAIVPNRLINYSTDSPWLGFTGYTSALWDVDQDLKLRVMSANSGVAAQIEQYFGTNSLSWQVGSVQEDAGFLGNYGFGAVSLGSSTTLWTQVGYTRSLSNQLSIKAQFGQGVTQVQNNPISMIQILGPIQTRSWSLGLQRSHNFTANDRITMGYAKPISIKSGHAQITGITEFDYQPVDEDNTNLLPIVETESVNLKSANKEYNLVLNYQHPLTKTGLVSYNLIQRYNVGGQIGITDTYFGINLSWTN